MTQETQASILGEEADVRRRSHWASGTVRVEWSNVCGEAATDGFRWRPTHTLEPSHPPISSVWDHIYLLSDSLSVCVTLEIRIISLEIGAEKVERNHEPFVREFFKLWSNDQKKNETKCLLWDWKIRVLMGIKLEVSVSAPRVHTCTCFIWFHSFKWSSS